MAISAQSKEFRERRERMNELYARSYSVRGSNNESSPASDDALVGSPKRPSNGSS